MIEFPFPLSRTKSRARVAWLRYHVSTENFDRCLPGRLSEDGTWIVMPEYRRESCKFAAAKLETLKRELLHVPRIDADSANDAVLSMSHEERTRELERWLNPEVKPSSIDGDCRDQ